MCKLESAKRVFVVLCAAALTRGLVVQELLDKLQLQAPDDVVPADLRFDRVSSCSCSAAPESSNDGSLTPSDAARHHQLEALKEQVQALAAQSSRVQVLQEAVGDLQVAMGSVQRQLQMQPTQGAFVPTSRKYPRR